VYSPLEYKILKIICCTWRPCTRVHWSSMCENHHFTRRTEAT